MKTPNDIMLAIKSYKAKLAEIQDRIEWTKTWLDSADFKQNPDLFVKQMDRKKELEQEQKDMEFKIRFAQWVLDDKQED